jgi:hypothetical protein
MVIDIKKITLFLLLSLGLNGLSAMESSNPSRKRSNRDFETEEQGSSRQKTSDTDFAFSDLVRSKLGGDSEQAGILRTAIASYAALREFQLQHQAELDGETLGLLTATINALKVDLTNCLSENDEEHDFDALNACLVDARNLHGQLESSLSSEDDKDTEDVEGEDLLSEEVYEQLYRVSLNAAQNKIIQSVATKFAEAAYKVIKASRGHPLMIFENKGKIEAILRNTFAFYITAEVYLELVPEKNRSQRLHHANGIALACVEKLNQEIFVSDEISIHNLGLDVVLEHLECFISYDYWWITEKLEEFGEWLGLNYRFRQAPTTFIATTTAVTVEYAGYAIGLYDLLINKSLAGAVVTALDFFVFSRVKDLIINRSNATRDRARKLRKERREDGNG